VQLELPVLDAGATTTFSSPSHEEAALVLLAGDVEWNDTRATRTDVFDAPAAAVYLPPGSAVDVVARERSELALVSTIGCALVPGDENIESVSPEHVVIHDRGRAPWQRTVHDVIADNVGAHRLIVGETFNEPGQWSSFPPHKHDGADGEPALEEVYYFRFDRAGGFGFQGLYDTAGEERAVFLRHGTVVGIPHGYHPVAAAPGYRLYYLWALVGARRELAMHEDPAHRWLHDTTN
jgi:5-deoxy-glucuronate isomerase